MDRFTIHSIVFVVLLVFLHLVTLDLGFKNKCGGWISNNFDYIWILSINATLLVVATVQSPPLETEYRRLPQLKSVCADDKMYDKLRQPLVVASGPPLVAQYVRANRMDRHTS
jgi:hypothetical protein